MLLKVCIVIISVLSARAFKMDQGIPLRQSYYRPHQADRAQDRSSLRFIVMGDWGGLPIFPYRTYIEKAVAAQMGKVADQLDTDFVLGLGDNFYFEGVKDMDDPRFHETFENVFQAKSLDRKWYFIAGNHDHNGNVTAQIRYTDRSHRWTFPDYYYLLNFKIPHTDATVSILMIDTVVLCGHSVSDWSSEDLTGPPPEFKYLADLQWKWIENNLKTNNATYVIVAGHYPVWSISQHGPTTCLVEKLMPMLHKYKVTTFFCGHDHNLQHLQHTDYSHNLDYFVSGSANFISVSQKHKDTVPNGKLKFFWADPMSLGGFAIVEAFAQNMTFTFREANGTALYQHVMYPRKQESLKFP